MDCIEFRLNAYLPTDLRSIKQMRQTNFVFGKVPCGFKPLLPSFPVLVLCRPSRTFAYRCRRWQEATAPDINDLVPLEQVPIGFGSGYAAS